ncbi:hypothetical protein BHE74_00051545 [Ensete ventricosum]|nr:hypothetical protein BHE74_00051545 [Ensete ventricosum]
MSPPISLQVTVETLEKGFLIHVFSEKSCPGLLVSVLEVFEDLGLNVMEAKAACTDTFRLQAIGRDVRQGDIICKIMQDRLHIDINGESMDAEAVKEAVERAINGFFGVGE